MDTLDVKEKISPIFKKYGVKRARVFGSASRGEYTAQSDIDILLSLGKPMGMFAYMRMVREIEKNLGRKVDIVTEKSVDKFIKPYIMKDLQNIYEG
jgi:uncharacterized protein